MINFTIRTILITIIYNCGLSFEQNIDGDDHDDGDDERDGKNNGK